jgi:uncharacterized damage-inducible protein DinB
MAAKTLRTKPKRKRAVRAAATKARRADGQGAAEAGLAELCLRQWISRLEERFLPRLLECLAQLSEEEIWWRPNEASNSVGNLLLHLCGNMRQWIVSGLGGAADIRQRDKEFNERGPIARDALRDQLERTFRESCAVLARVKPGDLTRHYRIQQFDVTGYQAAAQVEEHVAYHLGQIIYVTKLKRSKDLGFTHLPSAVSAPSERKL